MRAVELQGAASSIARLLQESDVLSVIRECRAARGDAWEGMATQLLATGSGIAAALSAMDPTTDTVLRATHLDKLGTNEYWSVLASGDTDESERQAELVRLYSRVMFASNHLPMLVSLLESEPAAVANAPAQSAIHAAEMVEGEATLLLKLVDAGEKAADPDRVARAIDGIDMLYSACASLARKRDVELRLMSVSGSADRNIQFVGENETVQAISTIIESIPQAVENLDSGTDMDLRQLIDSLPVFADLATLRSLGTYSESDLNDIRDTMHQGVLLSLESGLLLVRDQPGDVAKAIEAGTTPDEYYDHYLRERERLAAGEGDSQSANTAADTAATAKDSRDVTVQNLRKGQDDR